MFFRDVWGHVLFAAAFLWLAVMAVRTGRRIHLWWIVPMLGSEVVNVVNDCLFHGFFSIAMRTILAVATCLTLLGRCILVPVVWKEVAASRRGS